MRLIPYSAHIDGLRAIAVVAVIANHLGVPILRGGFVGVDIFFVISGYLITAQTAAEVLAGNFSLCKFYSRRINRIFPALLVMLIAVATLALFLTSPADLITLFQSVVAAALGVSNIFIWSRYGNYFSENASEATLLHTWSLGVEEQFYAVWPLVLMVLLKTSGRTRWILSLVLFFGAVAVSEYGVRSFASATYYLMPTRFFELMMGGLLALGRITLRKDAIQRLGPLLGWVGVGLIFVSMLWIDKSKSFPGLMALLPCFGAVFLIAFGDITPGVNRCLASKPMVGIGLISYSLYLWHWPLIAYSNYVGVEINLLGGVLILLSSFVLATLSWRFVEVPARRTGAALSFRHVATMRLVMPIMLLALSCGIVIKSNGFPSRFNSQVFSLESDVKAYPDLARSGCHVATAAYATDLNPGKCRLGALNIKPDALLIGDSFANHFSGMVDELALVQGIGFIDYTMDGCPPILGYDNGKGREYSGKCIARNRHIFEDLIVKGGQYKKVVLASNWPIDDAAGQLLIETINRLLVQNVSITIIVPNQEIHGGYSCPVRNLMYGRSKECSVPQSSFPAYLMRIKSMFPMVHWIDPNSIICADGSCNPVLNGVALFRDSVHLNDHGSRAIGRALRDAGISVWVR